MTERLVKSPGTDHPISIDVNPYRVVVKVGGKVIADTSDALTLREASYPPVQYIPRRDVDMAALTAASTPRTVPTRATPPTTAFQLAGIVPSNLDPGSHRVARRTSMTAPIVLLPGP
jgi:hypothetical protein